MTRYMMTRFEAMTLILDALPDVPIVANCGATSRELAAIRHSEQHLYILDSMGLASSVGLGLALGLCDSGHERVIVLEGDGALLMNLNSLASIGYHKPAKLLLILLDNAEYASTGGQPTYSGQIDLAAMAEAAGIHTLRASNPTELASALTEIIEMDGPVFLHVNIEPGNTPKIPLLLDDPAVIGHRFTEWIQNKT